MNFFGPSLGGAGVIAPLATPVDPPLETTSMHRCKKTFQKKIKTLKNVKYVTKI